MQQHIRGGGGYKTELPHDLYAHNKKRFLEYIAHHKTLVQNWNSRLANENRKCYIFGAHITTQFFIAYGLNVNMIEAILDNDSYKQGRRVSGTTKTVLSPECLRGEGSVVVIAPQSPYIEEIKKDIIENINGEVEFWDGQGER